MLKNSLNRFQRSLFNTPQLAIMLTVLGGVVFAVQLWVNAHAQYSHVDEAAYAIKGLWFATGKFTPYQEYGPWTNHMPLSFLIPGYAQVLFGPGIRTIRYLSVLMAILGLLGVWITAKRLGGLWWGAFAVWSFALNPSLAKFYSISASQVLVFFLLAWVLAFSIGENIPTWRLLLGAALTGFMIFTRINMAPVLVFLIAYIFWQYEWRKGFAAMLASSAVIIIGLVINWPGIRDYIYLRLIPFINIPILYYLVGLSLFFLVVVFWKRLLQIIETNLFKKVFFVVFYFVLIIGFNWDPSKSLPNQFYALAPLLGIHTGILILGVGIYFLWIRGRGDGEYFVGGDKSFSDEVGIFRYYLIICAIEAIGAVVALIFIPTDPKNVWILGLSKSRVGMIAVMFLATFSLFGFLIKSLRNTKFTEAVVLKINSWLHNKTINSVFIVLFVFGLLLGLELTIQMLIQEDIAVKSFLIRLMPIYIFAALLSGQSLILISIRKIKLDLVWRYLRDTITAFLLVLLVLHLDYEFLRLPKIRSVLASIRSNFLPWMGFILFLVFWMRRKDWENKNRYKISIFLAASFFSLFIVHAFAALQLEYCVFCLQPYLAFFSQLGIFLIILSAPNFIKRFSFPGQLIFFLSLLLIFTGLGFVFNKHLGLPLLNIGFVIVAITSSVQYFLAQRDYSLKYSLSACVGIACLGLGLVFSPTNYLGGGYQDLVCDSDMISYYEAVGEELALLIPENSKIYWHGAPYITYLYLPGREIFPPQLNGSSNFYLGGDPEDLLKQGFWNEELGREWLFEADFIIYQDKGGYDWLEDAITSGEFQPVLNITFDGTCKLAMDYIVYQRIP